MRTMISFKVLIAVTFGLSMPLVNAGKTAAQILCCPVPLDIVPPGVPREIYTKSGDINIGGIFNIHKYSPDRPCGDQLHGTVQTQFVEAMVYAIRQINANDSLLHGITLGYSILDDCNSRTTGLAQALALVPRNRNCSENTTLDNLVQTPYDVVGVIGAVSSTVSMRMADLFNIFQLPQISALSTGDRLSDKGEFPYFLRLSGTDRFQAESIVDFIIHFNWTYVSVLGSSSDYGFTGASWTRQYAEESDICVAYSVDISSSANDSLFNAIISNLRLYSKAKVVVSFTPSRVSIGLLKAAKRAGVHREFIWIFSDGLSSRSSLNGLEDVALGSFFVKMYAPKVPEFDEYFTSLNPKHHQGNPWFIKFWEDHLNCTSSIRESEKVQCTFNETISHATGYRQDVRVSLFIDTVYTFAYGLEAYLRRHCSHVDISHLWNCIQGPLFLEHLKKVSFYGQTGHVHFDKNGDRKAKFMIDHFVNVQGSAELIQIALWAHDHTVIVDQDRIEWKVDIGANGVPESICSKPCAPGYRRVIGPVHCCWTCKKCRPNEITIDSSRECAGCALLTWPDDHFETCKPIKAYFMPWNDPLAITLAIFAISGIIACLTIAAIFFKQRNERIIMATCLELSCIFLIGGCVGYQTVFWYIGSPHPTVCVIRVLGSNMAATMTYAPLLAKTTRIFRVFCNGKKGIKRPRFISTKWQLILTFLLISLQVRKC